MSFLEYKTQPHTQKWIRHIVNQIKTKVSMQNTICIDVLRGIEYVAMSLDELFYIEIVEDTIMDTFGALAFPFEPCIFIKESIYDGARYGNSDCRFAIAHDFGHCILLHQPYRLLRGAPTTKQENLEWQADTFALEFLIPVFLFGGHTDREIAKMCGVPFEKVIMHRKTIDIDCATLKQRYIEFSNEEHGEAGGKEG
jgi:hypothetical protein